MCCSVHPNTDLQTRVDSPNLSNQFVRTDQELIERTPVVSTKMGSPPDDVDQRCSLDEVLKLVADTQRRQILRYLIANAEQPVPLEALVEHLSTDTSDDITSATTQATDRDRIVIQLHHLQLPKLADYGVIEYNASLQLVSYTEHPRVEALLQIEQRAGDENEDANGDDHDS